MFPWLMQISIPISDQTLLIVLIFVFAVIALLHLGASSFIQLVELVLSHGFKVVQQMQEAQQALMHSSDDKEASPSSALLVISPTTQDTPSSPSTEPTEETKSPKSS